MNTLFKNILQKIFLAGWEKNLRRHPLRWLELEVTRRCPLDCIHCGSSCSMETPYPQELSMDEILAVCRRLASVYDPRKIKVAVTGGEPLVRRDIFHLIARITEMGYRASVVTNGILINQDTPKLLYAAGIRSLSVSLDGMEATHNWQRPFRNAPVQNSFKRAISGLEILVQSGLFYVEVITTVNRRSINELDGLYALLSRIGVHGWRFSKVFPIGRAPGHPELFLTGPEVRRLLDYVKALRRDANRKIRDIAYCEEGCYGREYELEVRGFFTQCLAGVNMMTVLGDGSVTGCAAVSPQFIQGSVKKDDVVALWEEKFKPFRDRSWMRQGICGGCAQWGSCRGDGFHLWGNNGRDPAICNHGLLACKI